MIGSHETITIYSTSWCPDCWRTKRFLKRHEVDFKWIDIDFNKTGAEIVKKINYGKQIVPTIVFPDGSALSEPSDSGLAQKLDIDY